MKPSGAGLANLAVALHRLFHRLGVVDDGRRVVAAERDAGRFEFDQRGLTGRVDRRGIGFSNVTFWADGTGSPAQGWCVGESWLDRAHAGQPPPRRLTSKRLPAWGKPSRFTALTRLYPRRAQPHSEARGAGPSSVVKQPAASLRALVPVAAPWPCSPRCVRIRSITADSRMAAMILSWPPQFGQRWRPFSKRS